jgi:peptidoglycan hydrolase CwlO-like protein
MKLNGMIAASVVALLLTTACEKKSGASASASVGDKKVDVDVSLKERDDWVSKMKTQAQDVGKEIERLSKDGSAEAKAKAESLKEKSKGLNEQIEKAQSATAETWNDVKSGTKKAMDDVKDWWNSK